MTRRQATREYTAAHRGNGRRSAAALPDAGHAAVERPPARVPADREDRPGAVSVLRDALYPQGRRPRSALSHEPHRKGAKTQRITQRKRLRATTTDGRPAFASRFLCVFAPLRSSLVGHRLGVQDSGHRPVLGRRYGAGAAAVQAPAREASRPEARRARARLDAAAARAHARGERRASPARSGTASCSWRGAGGSRGSSRPARYDQAIVLPNSFKSALIPRLAGIGCAPASSVKRAGVLLNDARRLDTDALPLMAERFAAPRRAARPAAARARCRRPLLSVAGRARCLLARLGLRTDRAGRMPVPGRGVRARQALACRALCCTSPRSSRDAAGRCG